MGLLDTIFRPQGPVQSAVTPMHQYNFKNRWALIGTVASGKSTVAALLVLTAQTLQSQLPNFFCDVVENTSNILVDVSNLRRGHFPPKTTAYGKYATEAGLLLGWNTTPGEGALLGKLKLGKKQMHIPICDLAGEDLQAGQKGMPSFEQIGSAAFSQARQLREYVRESDGLILIAPASKALMFKDDVQIEREAADIEFDPDVNLARMMGDIVEHRRRVRKPLKGIAFVITKWDMIAPYAQDLGMDVTTTQGLNEFLDVCFPSTKMRIKMLVEDWGTRVEYFPSFVDVQRNGDGSLRKWDDDSAKILVKDRRIPSYGSQYMVNLINFVGSYAS